MTRRSDASGAAALSRPLAPMLTRYADGLVEASWLAGVACVPLLANRYSIGAFEPNKVALLRILALIALAAWLLKALSRTANRSEPRRPSRAGAWLILATCGLAIAHLAATLGSVAPAVSFWGSYDRMQGTYTVLSYLALFAAMVANLRDRDQGDRLVGTIVAASLPVAMYGIAQSLGLDPVPSYRAEYSGTSRVTSTLGNPVFLAAYLAMVWPLTLARVMEGTVLARTWDRIVSGWARTTVFILTAAAQLIAVVLTESRGPFLGLVVSSIGFLLVVAVLRRARRLLLWTMAVTLVGAVLLVLAGLAGIPLVSRLAEVSDPSRGSLGYRVEMWELAPRLLTAREPVPYPDGSPDPWQRLRLLIGFGPETLPVLIKPLIRISPSNPSPDAAPDRLHNEVWDTLVATGVVGLAATLGLTVGLLYIGLRRLGLAVGPRQCVLFWICTVAGGAVGGLIALSMYGSAASAAGVQLGLVVGQLAYLSLQAFARPELPARGQVDRNDLLVAALWAALIGHVVELSFSFFVAETALLFWAYAALLQRVDEAETGEPLWTQVGGENSPPNRRDLPAPPTSPPSRSRRQRSVARPAPAGSPPWWPLALKDGTTLTIMMITIGFLVLGTAKASTSVLEVFGTSLATPQPGSWPPGVLVLGLLGVWVSTAAILVISTRPPHSDPAPVRSLARLLLVSGALGTLYWMWLAADLAALSRQLLVDASSELANAEAYASVVTRYYVCLLALMAAFAAAQLAPCSPRLPGSVRLAGTTLLRAIAAPLVLGAALFAAWFVALRLVQADTVATMAAKMRQARLWEGAALAYRRAIELAPRIEQYPDRLARLYFDEAQLTPTAHQREVLLEKAEQTWKGLQTIGGLSRGYAPLASLYATWAFQTSDAERRLELARRASTQYAYAVVVSPNNLNLWHDWALLEQSLLKRPEEAHKKALRALQLDPRHESVLALLGNYESDRWRERPDTEDGRQALQRAAAYYERAADVATNKYPYLMAVAGARVKLDDLEHAIETYVSARPLASAAEVWKVDEALSRLYARTGARDLAVHHATLALESAPSEVRARLQALRTELR